MRGKRRVQCVWYRNVSFPHISPPCHAPAKWDAQGHVPADNKSGSTTAGGGEGSRVKEERALDGGEVGFGHELLSLGQHRQTEEAVQTILTR